MKLLQHVVDERAVNEPERIIYVVPRSEKSPDEGFDDVSYSVFANAINRTAAWLKNNVKGPSGQTLAFISPQDVRYLVFMLAANKAGHQLMLLSPRNSANAQKHLLGAAKCRYFLCGQQYAKSTKEIVDSLDGGVEALTIPSIQNTLDKEEVADVPFEATWEEKRHTPFIVMHTSGTSTGRPKPIIINHGYYALDELMESFPGVDDQGLRWSPFDSETRFCHAMPLFHIGALFDTMFKVILQGGTCVLLPGDTQIEADMITKTLDATKCRQVFSSPTMIENLLERADARKILAALETIVFGSGPMANEVGNALLKLNPRSINIYGATEMNLLPSLKLDDPVQDWQYHSFHPWTGATFEPVDGDETMAELVIKPSTTPVHGPVQSCFENFPDATEYRTKDVFTRHPTKKNLWKWYSRADDVITFETGEKLNPTSMESIVSAHPKVAAAVIVGQRRMQPALLIEPSQQVDNHKSLLDEIWPTIQKANAEAPSYGKIVKQLVLFSNEHFKRTPKGTIQRTKTEEMLAQEISNLYEGGGESVYSDAVDLASQEEVQKFVNSVVHDVLDFTEDFNPDTNMFDYGLDSLRAAELVRALNAVLKRSASNGHKPPRIDVSTVYGDPTVENLSSTLSRLAAGGSDTPTGEAWVESANRLLSRHTPVLATGAAMLTGSTGSLGAHFLHLLLNDQTYSHVYCLNRSDGARKGYFKTFPSDKKLSHRVTFLQTSAIWEPYFGLPGEVFYRDLLNNVRTVIHNAWPVNFLMAVEAANPSAYASSFEPQLDGVANIIRFCAESRHKARLVFVSSVSSVMNSMKSLSKPAPEAVVRDPLAPDAGGYPRSKWVTECMMDTAVRDYPDNISLPIIIRPGQICGPLAESVEDSATGPGSCWNQLEAIPRIFISSNAIGVLPSTIGHEGKLRWVPVDVVAKTTLEIIHHVDRMTASELSQIGGASAWNVVNIHSENGREQTWEDVVPHIRDRLEEKSGRKIPIVPMAEWVECVENFGTDATKNPAIKLLDFMQSLVVTTSDDGLGVATDNRLTLQASPSLRKLDRIQPEWIDYWMEGWGL